MNLAAEKSALIRQFNDLQDLNIVEAIKNFLKPKDGNRENEQWLATHSLSYSPAVMKANDRKYILNYPLRCLLEIEEDHFVIKNEILDIYAVGKTTGEAETDFGDEFDNIYKTLNSFGENQLTTRMSNIKKFINLYVKQVI